MSDDRALDVSSDTGPWAMVPAWVLDSGVSPRAVFLYCVLSLYADGGARGRGATTRTRRKLADRLDCSVNTLDRAVAELEGIHAVRRTPTRDASGDQGPNRWIVFRMRPGGPKNGEGGGPTDAAPEETRPPLDPDPQKTLSRDEDFETFWSIYPRKEAKKAARDAFKAALKRAKPEQIVAGAQRYRDDPNRESAYTKHAATWLRSDCWDDDPLPPRPKNGNARPTYKAPPIDDDRTGGSRVLRSEDL